MSRKKVFVFDIVNDVIMVILALIFIIPFWIILTSSLSVNSRLQANGVSILFQGFTFDGYKFLFSMNDLFLRSMLNSLITSFTASVLSVIVCTLAAYVLSKKYFVGRKFFTMFLMISMFFSGGTIPTYLIIRGIGIYDTIWALIIPGVASAYSVLLVRNYFYSLPDALEEAALLDGGGDWDILCKIYMPLSVPMMFTIGIMTFIGKWNEWLPSLLYLGTNHKDLWTAQYVLRQMLNSMQALFGSSSGGSVTNAPLISAKNAGIVTVILPLIIISPILHKYFTAGLTAGAVKG